MFNSKKTQLFETRKTKTSGNSFIQQGLKKESVTQSGNNAKKYSTTGNSFVDQFGKLGSYKKPRSFNEIAADCEVIWASNIRHTVLFIFYIRMITRVVTLFSGVSTRACQKGAELKHEGIMRMIWLHMKSYDTFWNNIGLFVSVGSWKDIITMLQYDLVHHGWDNKVLDWEKFGNLILSGLENKNTVNLVKKYLPQIKARSKCTTVESQADTMIGKWICGLLFGWKETTSKYKKYRKLKSSGTAHEWQQLISQGKHNLIDFGKIHGRALNLLVRSKYLFNQGLSEKYAKWVEKPETKVKYTGFVHELFQDYGINSRYFSRSWNDVSPAIPLTSVPKHIQDTVNKQFDTLVNKAKSDDNYTELIVVRDTSGSMSSTATGTNMTCYDIGKALALYFSEFLSGPFANNWIEFHDDAALRTWTGRTPMEKWFNDDSGYYGSTNFQSVIGLLCSIKNSGVPESDFPKGILCISDSEFNPSSLNQTNVKTAKKALTYAGFSKEYVDNFVIILWNLQSGYYGRGTGEKFETYGNTPNVFYFSGYSAATISFLASKVKNASELFEAAMDQEILNMIEV
jgi:hypothetical protein